MALTATDIGEQVSLYLECKLRYGMWNGVTPPTHLFGEINFNKFAMTAPKQEFERLKSNMEGSVGQDLAVVAKPVENSLVELKAEFSRAPLDFQALAMGATVSEFAQTGATVADRAVTLEVGKWTPLWDLADGPTPLASFTSLKTAADATVAADHYEIDLMGGQIRPLDATGVTGTKATFVTKTVDGVQYDGGQALNRYLYLMGTATDKRTGKRGLLIIHRANVAPDGEWDPVAGGYLKGSLTGSCETPAFPGYTRSSPWTFIATDVAAT